jgi:ribosome-binding factor A
VDVRPDEIDPGLFFDETRRYRKGQWKAMQLCKQVERAATLTLADQCASELLAGAAVASVEPAPDCGRLLVTVVLDARRRESDMEEAAAALRRMAGAFREEAARSIHRKRTPELAFSVRLGGGEVKDE